MSDEQSKLLKVKIAILKLYYKGNTIAHTKLRETEILNRLQSTVFNEFFIEIGLDTLCCRDQILDITKDGGQFDRDTREFTIIEGRAEKFLEKNRE